MNREGLIILSTAIALLAGCAGGADQREDAQCVSFGYRAGTAEYGACRQFLYAERQRRGTALMAIGAGMMQGSQPPPPSTTIYNVGGRSYTCVRAGNVVNCS